MKTSGYYCIARYGNKNPEYVHNTQEEAINEAKRLSRWRIGPVAIATIVAVITQSTTYITGEESCPKEIDEKLLS